MLLGFTSLEHFVRFPLTYTERMYILKVSR